MREIRNKSFMLCDFHSHILPGIDDGAKDADEAKAILDASAAMGIDRMVATPHFRATESKLEDFLRERTTAVDRLLSIYDKETHPRIYLGAEVDYFYGIGSAKDIAKLTVDGTKYILIEMPYTAWNDGMLREIEDIRTKLKLCPIIAHMERYLKLQSSSILRKVYIMGIDLQFNSTFLTDSNNKKIIKKLIKQKTIHLIGSDCHNMKARPQNLMDAVAALELYSEGFETLSNVSLRSNLYLDYANNILQNQI